MNAKDRRVIADKAARPLSRAYDAEAQRLFTELNRRYFRGRLPYCWIYRARRKYCLGATEGARIIMIHSALEGEQLRRVLLHEMCHIVRSGRGRGMIGRARGLPHGPVFQAKVRRLAALGEMVAETPAPKALSRDMVRVEMRAIACDQPQMPWHLVRAELASSFMQELDGVPLERLAPWAEREWHRVVAKYRGAHDRRDRHCTEI